MRLVLTVGMGFALTGPAAAQKLVEQTMAGAMSTSVTGAERELSRFFSVLQAGDSRGAWNQTSPHFKQLIPVENWTQAWSGVVGTLQPVENRRVTAIRYLPAESDRHPEIVAFDTRLEFRGGTFGGETVLVALEDGRWRVWDYAVSPSTQYLAPRYYGGDRFRFRPIPLDPAPAPPRPSNIVNPNKPPAP